MRYNELTEQKDPVDGDNSSYGYWRQTSKPPSEYKRPPRDSRYPWPEEGQPWQGQEEFIKNLKIVQEHSPPSYREMGYSHCRICKSKAGSGVFFIDNIGSWPSGYIHYIEDHNVRPPKQFISKINNLAKRLLA